MHLRKTILFFGLILMTWGCNKFDEGPTYHGQIKNTMGDTVHLDFYTSREDYDNNRNALLTTYVPPYGSFEIPQDWEGGSRLYLDWYTNDYMNTNWGSDPKFIVSNITKDFDPVMSITQRFSYARVLWLGMGNNTLSNWTAFDYRYFNANSFWNSLTEHQKYRKLTLRKNQTGTLSYKDGSGTIRNLDFTYAFSFNAGNTVFVSFDGQFGTTHTIKADTGPNGLDIEFDTVTTSTYFPPDVQGGTSSYNYYYKRVP